MLRCTYAYIFFLSRLSSAFGSDERVSGWGGACALAVRLSRIE